MQAQPDDDSEALVTAVARGDRGALARLYDRFSPLVYAVAARILGNRADADECFQEACLDAFRRSRREEVRSWRGLLQRLAAARAIDRLRRRPRTAGAAVEDWDALEGPDASPVRAAEEAELAGRLREALADLPARQAEVFCLCGLEEWSYQEAADQLGVSVVAVGVLLHRARCRLRQLLAAAVEPSGEAGPRVPRKEPS